MTLYEYDDAVRGEGRPLICGVDEAGRGPLAGPVYAAAVILPLDAEIPGLNDSKKLTEVKREALFDAIFRRADAYAIASASEREIDDLNILRASLLAMRRAVEALSVPPSLVLIDGNRAPELPYPIRTVVKGDALSASIAAASILAKVARDRKMLELDAQYPQYAFSKHKGYPTKLHYERLESFGKSPAHRESFLKKWGKSRA